MIGAGTVINPLFKVLTTVAILAAISIFVVKPILSSTERISRDVGNNVQDNINKSLHDSNYSSARSSALSRAGSLLAGSQPWVRANRAVVRCVRTAGKRLNAMNGCENFAESATTALSARNFSLSYADSLKAEGKTSAARQVRVCVQKAGFSPRKMSHCQRLSDKLLFG